MTEGSFQSGVVALLDALGFKQIRGAHGAAEIVETIARVRKRVTSHAQLMGTMRGPKMHVAAFSDTIALSALADGTSPRRDLNGCISVAVSAASSLILESAGAPVPLAYRGCISVGDLFEGGDSIFLGSAIDDAARWYESANAAMIWLMPSARNAFAETDSMAVLEWEVPLKDRGALSALVVNPFYGICIEAGPVDLDSNKLDEFERALLGTFDRSTDVDVAQKRQYTKSFLSAARAHTLSVHSTWLEEAYGNG